MADMICPFCKKNWPIDFKWCMEDGAELEQNLGQYEVQEDEAVPGMECPECGGRIDPRDEFCAGCGSRLQSREEAEAAVTQFSCPKCGSGINPADPFCGKCGAPLGEAADEPEAAAGGPGLCPNCGMQNAPEDPFCGTCGQQLSAARPAPPAPQAARYERPVQQNIICPQCSLELPPGTDYCHSCGHQFVKDKDEAGPGRHAGMGACPNCGMEIQPGDVFCGTCGYSMSGQEAGAAPAAPAAAAPPPQAEAQNDCPNCGMAIDAGETMCGTCGYSMDHTLGQDAEPEPAAPSAPEPGAGLGGGCPNCGMQNAPGDDMCGTCGFDLTGGASQGTPPEEPSAPADTVSEPSAQEGCPNCGMTIYPGETMCGTCGFDLTGGAPESAAPEEPAAAPPAPEPPADSQTSCPNCGMEVEPGETFCGTCGTSLTHESPQEPPAGAIDLDAPELQVSDAKLALRCPECGSTRTTKGGAFCEVCGAMTGAEADEPLYDETPELPEGVRAGDLGDPFAAPPRETDDSQQQPMPSLGDITGDDPVCPQCGVEGYPGMETCASCGASLVPQSEVVEATAGILHTPTPSLESLADEAPPVSALPPDAPSLGDVTGEALICAECGMEAPDGMQEHDGCLGCGGELIKVKDQVRQVQESLYAPPPEIPEPPAPEPVVEEAPPPPPMPLDAATGDEKVCSCCGTPNPPEAEFCAVCGVDFD